MQRMLHLFFCPFKKLHAYTDKKLRITIRFLTFYSFFVEKWYYLGKKRGGIEMKNLLNRYLSNLMTFGLEKVATGAATKCCYFVLYQPKVPENLKKFSKSKK